MNESQQERENKLSDMRAYLLNNLGKKVKKIETTASVQLTII